MNRHSLRLPLALTIALVSALFSACQHIPYCFGCDADGGDGGGLDAGSSDAQSHADGCIPTGLEICDGVDNDCNGIVDDGITATIDTVVVHVNDDCNLPGVGSSWPSTSPCHAGKYICDPTSHQVVCGAGAVLPVAETCDGIDNNCNGSVDETFDLTSDPDNCGSCGNSCGALANAYTRCGVPDGGATDGGIGDSGMDGGSAPFAMCLLQACKPGFFHVETGPGAGPGCNYECSYHGQEICNGEDDDCDGVVDNDLGTPPPVCLSTGECGVVRAGGSAAMAMCAGTNGWVCHYDNDTVSRNDAGQLIPETNCDGLDNDCNGIVDDAFPTVGGTCTAGSGPCLVSGANACNATHDGIVCLNHGDIVQANMDAREVESCDGIDNDCDGFVDNGDTGIAGAAYKLIRWVAISSSVQMFPYEASHADALATGQGSALTACAKPGVLPWTNITHAEAEMACESLGGGARLCAEDEWQAACEHRGRPAGGGTACLYSSTTGCATYDPNACNGLDYNPAMSGFSEHGVQLTGALSTCGAQQGAGSARTIYDLSGNVREWVKQRSDGTNPLRGGAYDTSYLDLQCSWDFLVADNNYYFVNTGFRCCQPR